jgi:hypothetical protein
MSQEGFSLPTSTSSRPSSSASSPPAGLPGLVGFATSLKGAWRGVFLKAGLGFLAFALLWLLLAPLYAHFLAALARPLIPSIESSPGTRYTVEGTTIIAERPILRQRADNVTVSRTLLRETSGDYPLALLAALVLATPFSVSRQLRVLGITLCLLIFTQYLSLLVNIEYTKLSPTQTAAGLVVSVDYFRVKMIVFDWLYAFTEFTGRGLFALLLYFGAIALVWGRPERGVFLPSVGRNDPCPCGSGLKAKRCCWGR